MSIFRFSFFIGQFPFMKPLTRSDGRGNALLEMKNDKWKIKSAIISIDGQS
jgi:hypothetical protein